MRDSQRTKVYKAERQVCVYSSYGDTCTCPQRFSTVAEVEEFANLLYTSDAAMRLRQQFRGPRFQGIRVRDGRGRRRGLGGGGVIHMPRWTRCTVYTAHEVTHNLIAVPTHHGPIFAQGFYRLLAFCDDLHGTDLAVRLGTAFEAERVEW